MDTFRGRLPHTAVQLSCMCQSADLGLPIVQKAALVTKTAVQMLILGAGCGIWNHTERQIVKIIPEG